MGVASFNGKGIKAVTVSFKQLQEKLVMGSRYPYLINPTKSEILGFAKREDTGALRGLWWEDDFYIWNAFSAIHGGFAKNILGVTTRSVRAVSEVPINIRVNIDPMRESEGNFMGAAVPERIKSLVNDVTEIMAENMIKDMLDSTDPEKIKARKQLRESRIKDPRITYLEDPTASEFIGFFNRCKEGVRLWRNPETKTIFVWDAYEMWHHEFVERILGIDEVAVESSDSASMDKNDIYVGAKIASTPWLKAVIVKMKKDHKTEVHSR